MLLISYCGKKKVLCYDCFKKYNNEYPTAIVANTIKGKGVSFMENNVDWHHKAPNPEQFQKALSEYE